MEPISTDNSVNISTKRTAVNIGVLTATVALVAKFTGWNIQLNTNDLLLLSPVIAAGAGIGYRISRWASAKWPSLGWVLFGSGQEPASLKKIGS